MKILGIDPGLATVGVGIVVRLPDTSLQVVDFCTIETAKGLSLSQRLLEIGDDLADVLREHKPDLAVIEKIYFAANQKTAIDVAQARGVILVTVEETGIPIVEPTPLQLKTAITGDGQADKKQMQTMLARMLRLELEGVPDDAVDALGLAVFGAVYEERLVRS